MNRDPFYRRIENRLADSLDADLFERCAADLLCMIYPGLVPIRGGDDAGMDGAIPDGEGEPFPLVTTTSHDTTGNLRRNLQSYLDRGGKRRKVLFATSRVLTQRRRMNLYERATKHGFTLIQIYDGAYFANLLYRAPKWCKELLGLSGDPSPLSIVPRSESLWPNTSVIGREKDIAWLRETHGDRLLVGQPGSGKTFLLQQLAREGWGLFVISRDRGEVAGGIRAQEPTILIVDDATPDDLILKDLRQLREDTHAEFEIVATCWPRYKEKLTGALNLVESQVHTLGLLTRPEIAKVIEGTGLRCGIPVMNELVGQAEGRPGLAATLAHVSLHGGWDEVISGDRLRVFLLGEFPEDVVPMPILAYFSLGGNRGLKQQAVAAALGTPIGDIWKAVRGCRAAGILYDVGDDYLSVRPPMLRHALVREVFFKGAESLPIVDVAREAGEDAVDVEVLIGARARGALVPDDTIVPRLVNGRREQWLEYAWLGKRETEWVLCKYPMGITEIADPALHYSPGLVLPLLLQEGVGDQRALHSHPEAPLRLMRDWIESARPGSGDVVARRKLLLEAVCSWIESGNDLETGLRACEFVMSLKYRTIGPLDVRNSAQVTQGAVTLEEATTLRSFWPTIVGFYEKTDSAYWEPLYHIIRNWAYPYVGTNASLPTEVYDQIRAFAGEMLKDLLRMAEGELDVYHWAHPVADDLHLETEIPIDEDFATLYPYVPRLQDRRASEARHREAVQSLAVRWSQEVPVLVANRLAHTESVFNKIPDGWLRWSPLLCKYIAQSIDRPLAWSQAMIDAHIPGDLIVPFLTRAVGLGLTSWQKQVAACFEREEIVQWMLGFVLTLATPPRDLVDLTLSRVSDWPNMVLTWCSWGQVPEDMVGLLLRHSDQRVAEAAANGEWHADPGKHVRQSLRGDWHQVVINSWCDYWLKEVFEQDSRLAFEWLKNHLQELPYSLSKSEEDVVCAAIGTLDSDARRLILSEMSVDFRCLLAIKLLVGDDLELYQEFLANDSLAKFHLVPLLGMPDESWIEKTRVALTRYTPEEIAQAIFTSVESPHWQEWEHAFDKLSGHLNERIVEIGRLGKAYAQERYEIAQANERHDAIYGWRTR